MKFKLGMLAAGMAMSLTAGAQTWSTDFTTLKGSFDSAASGGTIETYPVSDNVLALFAATTASFTFTTLTATPYFLVQFWTYTCINWLRTLAYIRAWSEKYKDHGLVVIGVHTPEFEFEHNLANVRHAAKELRVEYPIAIDNDYAIWRAFDNYYWPALYFVDAQGQIRHRHFGEGQYEQSEMVIQQLLTEAGSIGIGDELVSVDSSGV